jgi:molybdate transport system ATP-binding protein
MVAIRAGLMTLRFDATVERGTFRLDAQIEVKPGEVLAVLGPNGAGKSTLLRAIAGLLAVQSGTIALADVVFDDAARSIFVPAERRNLGLMFQDHRLFPHLRVVDNIAFGLRSRGVARAVAQDVAHEWIARLGIDDLASRHPQQLSGGQAQRVALARALASAPGALLLDEPLAALDAQTRAEVQAELREHLAAFDGPTLLVTHDPLDALLLATRIVVIERGAVAQHGTPAEVSSRPVTSYVARMVGVNLYRGRASGGTVALDGGGEIAATDAPDGRVFVAVRPSAFTVHIEHPHGISARIVWAGTVRSMTPLADRIRLTVDGPQPVIVDVTAPAVAELELVPGTELWLTAKATDVTTYPDVAV